CDKIDRGDCPTIKDHPLRHPYGCGSAARSRKKEVSANDWAGNRFPPFRSNAKASTLVIKVKNIRLTRANIKRTSPPTLGWR
ncbi:MAG: hypothetical protein ABIU09_11950, partial [Pyrinomonadaceae bacterium]